MKKVSIVMPLYNVENCLPRAVRSVMAQDHDDWELILVDDGSPDHSGEIADRFHEEYPDRIIAVHQANAGQGGARNTGVTYATGDYLFFMDSDDEIEPDLLSFCVGRMEQEAADVIAFEYHMVNEDGGIMKTVRNPYGFSQSGDLKADKSYLLLQGLACIKMFRLPFYRKSGVRFLENIRYEDLLWTEQILLKAEKVIYTARPLYRYYMSQNSAMRNKDVERNRELFTIMDQMFAFFRENDAFDAYYDELCAITIDNVYVASSLRLIRIDRKLPLIREFAQYLKEHFPDYRHNKYIRRMSRQYRLTFLLLECHLPIALEWLTRFKDRKRG